MIRNPMAAALLLSVLVGCASPDRTYVLKNERFVLETPLMQEGRSKGTKHAGYKSPSHKRTDKEDILWARVKSNMAQKKLLKEKDRILKKEQRYREFDAIRSRMATDPIYRRHIESQEILEERHQASMRRHRELEDLFDEQARRIKDRYPRYPRYPHRY